LPQKIIMKTKLFFSIFYLLISAVSCSQTKHANSELNLNFENIQDGKPQGWFIYYQPNYSVSLDSVIVKSGKYSIAIESTGDHIGNQPITLILPENYDGKQITLSGYIKTENVTGAAFLAIKVNPYVAIKTSDEIIGTNDWKKYEVTVDLFPELTKDIIVLGGLSGSGKMWLDNLKVTIDGKELSKIKSFQPELFPAVKDKKFDNGSNIILSELNEQKIVDLELLGRIWGFLKYHHPAIATGNYNWDYELFRILPSFLKTSNTQQRDKILLNWIDKYGRISKCKDCQATPDSAFLKPDLSWIDKSDMNLRLKDMLHKIYLNRYQGNQYYVRIVSSIGNPVFLNEKSYSIMSYPDAGFRLLALFRYWNMIDYFYPNKYLTDKNWNTVLKEYIPKFLLTKTELDYELVVLKLIGEIDDTHAQLWEGRQKIDSMRGYWGWGAPFQVKFIENQLVVTKYYIPEWQGTTLLKIGDIITHINGKSVEAIVDSVKVFYPASNEAARIRDIANDMLRSNKNTIFLKYKSSNQLIENGFMLKDWGSLYPYMYPKDTTKCYKFLSKDIGYVTLKTIKNEDVPAIKKEFINTKGIIIDIRNYPSTSVIFSLGSLFVSKSTHFAMFTMGNANNPGEFKIIKRPDYKLNPEENTYLGKLVVLVNEKTQSHAEFTALALRAGNNTTIIGSQTAGADGNVSEIALPGGLKTYISGIGVYYPDGRQTQRIGIVPDIEVKPTIKGIREGRDEVLEKAVEIIKNDNKDKR